MAKSPTTKPGGSPGQPIASLTDEERETLYESLTWTVTSTSQAAGNAQKHIPADPPDDDRANVERACEDFGTAKSNHLRRKPMNAWPLNQVEFCDYCSYLWRNGETELNGPGGGGDG